MTTDKWDLIATPTTPRSGEIECELSEALQEICDAYEMDLKLMRIPDVGAGRLCYTDDKGRLFQVDLVNKMSAGEDISEKLLRAVRMRF